MPARVALPASLGILLALTSCAVLPPGASPMPVPSGTSSPGALGATEIPADDVHGWLVSVTNNYMTATARLCAIDTIWTEPDSEYAGIYAERNGGMPDGFGNAVYEVDPHGIRLAFNSKRYFMGYTEGTAGIGTSYEFQGTFTFERDANGVPTHGSGTGTGRIIHPSGDVDNGVTDSMSFTLSPIPEPDWCGGEFDEDGTLIEG